MLSEKITQIVKYAMTPKILHAYFTLTLQHIAKNYNFKIIYRNINENLNKFFELGEDSSKKYD